MSLGKDHQQSNSVIMERIKPIKNISILFLIGVLFSGCSSVPQVDNIATSVAGTVAAQQSDHQEQVSLPTATNIQPPTRTPKPTFDRHAYETQVFATAAAKPTTHRPTITSIPKITYILETGWCMLDVSIDEVSGKDPKTVQWCKLDAREQIELALGQYMELTLNNLDGGIQVYCALFSLDGTFIMSDMDTTGSGKVNCPHE